MEELVIPEDDPIFLKILEDLSGYGVYCPTSLSAKTRITGGGEKVLKITATLGEIPLEQRRWNAVFAMSDVLRNRLEIVLRDDDRVGEERIQLITRTRSS